MGLVFVYGTLRQGEQYCSLLAGSRLRSSFARIAGDMADTGRGYPILTEGGGLTAGELYEITEETLHKLDELEDYYGPDDARNEYERVISTVFTDEGTVEAWVYMYRHPHQYPAVPENDWKLYRMKREASLLYFAYGSCMDLQRIMQAGRGEAFAEVAGRGVLEGFRVAFTLRLPDGGRADLLETGGCTEGKLYRITPECLEGYLYAREGVGEGLYRPAIVYARCTDGSQQAAVTFVGVAKQQETAPPELYMREILRGARPVVSPKYYASLEVRFREEFGFQDI